jgi:hypothetical protein
MLLTRELAAEFIGSFGWSSGAAEVPYWLPPSPTSALAS